MDGNKQTISLCMIVKDEADWIGQCLDSVRGLVSEMIVVDTGSTDKTVDIAREKGAAVHKFTWINDFAAARNLSLSLATGDWILVLDADETLDAGDFEKIRRLINSSDSCYLMTQRHYTEDPRLSNYVPCSGQHKSWEKSYSGYFESSLVRLFPRHPDIKYVGYVHELVEYSLKDHPVFKISHSEILIHHYGHTPEVLTKKNKRNLYQGLGEAKVSDAAGSWKNYFELGIEYNISGKLPESAEALKKSAELNPFYVDTWVNLGYVQCELAQYEEAAASLKNALKLNGRSAQAFCNLGVVYMRINNFVMAERCLTNAIIVDPKYVNAFCNLGKTLANMQKLSEAVLFYRRALELMPNCPTALDDLKTIYEAVG